MVLESLPDLRVGKSLCIMKSQFARNITVILKYSELRQIYKQYKVKDNFFKQISRNAYF